MFLYLNKLRFFIYEREGAYEREGSIILNLMFQIFAKIPCITIITHSQINH